MAADYSALSDDELRRLYRDSDSAEERRAAWDEWHRRRGLERSQRRRERTLRRSVADWHDGRSLAAGPKEQED